MNFRIAETFTDSLAWLTADEQRAVKITAFDVQVNPANPGLSFHRLDKAKDKNFWSVRASGAGVGVSGGFEGVRLPTPPLPSLRL